MKMFCTVLALLAAPILLGAQQIRGDFEQWDSVNVNNVTEEPSGWKFETGFGAGRDSSAYSGKWAVQIWNWYNHVPGLMVLGDVRPKGGQIAGGMPIAGLPQKLVGRYKFVPGVIQQGEDSAFIRVRLKRYDAGNGRTDTLTAVDMKLGASDAWKPFEMMIPAPADGAMPDSVMIAFASSEHTYCKEAYCCHLTLDDVALVASSGVPYRMEGGKLVPAVVAPNPLRSVASISFDGASDGQYQIMVVDAAGSTVRSMDVVGNRVDLERGDLAAGGYLFIVRDANGATVASGRFVAD